MNIFTKKIANFEPEACGLDISDLSVKAVKIDHQGSKQHVAGFGQGPVAPGSVSDGIITKPENVVQGIHAAFANAVPKKIKTKRVVCSLPEVKAFLRIINIPQMSEKEAHEAVKWEMEANIPMSIDQVYYDWQAVPFNFSRDKSKMSVLVVAVAKTIVDQYLDVVHQAGLEVAALEIESIAQARSLLNQKEKKMTTLIVDIGDRRTGFLIAYDNVPCFTSSIPISAQSMTEAIAKSLKLSQKDAEVAKVSYGIGSALKNDHVFKAVQPVLENFSSEIKKSIDFYLTGLRYSSSIDTIVLCGGGARTKGIVPYLSRRVGKNIILGNPWTNMSLERSIPPIDREGSVQYSAAVGLALRNL